MGAMGVNREQLAEKCARIEKVGGSVRDYLSEAGYISPWGTWFRLQKEELGRKDFQITDGKGQEDMRKITLEQKKKAVKIALDGGNPLDYLKKLGSANPSASWYAIKQTLKEADPETYELLPDLRGKTRKDENEKDEKEEETMTCCAASTRNGVEVPDEIPEVPETVTQTEEVPVCTKPLNYDGFIVTGLKTEIGEFRISNNGYLYFGGPSAADELEMPLELWQKFAQILPRAMAILGISAKN